jgi:hypothetical protein
MATLPLADGACLLGVHPKTLCHWLKQANIPLVAHPRDARIKCVTEEGLQQAALLHGRLLQASLPLDAASPALVASGPGTRSWPESERGPASCACSLPASSPSEADLIQKLSCLETKVRTLSEQLAQLALALLLEREQTVEQRLSALESTLQTLRERAILSHPLPESLVGTCESRPSGLIASARQLNPAEQLVRSRMPPLIEYSRQGTYVMVSSQEGELPLEPDSAEWFDWLATISSFRFVGQQGRFTAYREAKHHAPTRSWSAHRSIHQRRYKHHLGVTDRLTIAWLEQTAATFQTYVDAR